MIYQVVVGVWLAVYFVGNLINLWRGEHSVRAKLYATAFMIGLCLVLVGALHRGDFW